MVRLDEVEATIQELEQQKLTMDSCQKLAVLYSVRDHNQPQTNTAQPFSVMPSYNTYCMDKRKYQLGQITETAIIDDIRYVCSDLLLLVQRIYNGTDTNAEREQLRAVLKEISSKYL